MHWDEGSQTVCVKGGCVKGLDYSGAAHIWTRSAVVKIPEGVERWEMEPDDDDDSVIEGVKES
jgi:hypothetical protein